MGALVPASGGSHARRRPRGIRAVLFDWGNTLMVDDGRPGPMVDMAAGRRRARRGRGAGGAARALPSLRGDERRRLRRRRGVWRRCDRVGLARFIDRVFSSRDIGARKPDPAFYAAALEALRADAAARGEPPLRADEVVMVGDNYENDVAGALAAGLRAVWLAPDGTPWPDGSAPERASRDRLARELPGLRRWNSRARHPGAGQPGPQSLGR